MNLPQKFIGWLTVNRACNLRCEWCYANSMGFSKNEDMDINTVKQSIEFFRTLPLQNVILIGGEPTIHPNFLEIVRMIRKANFRTLLVTNSVKLADKDFFQSLIDAGIDSITTSFKAGSDEQYQHFTGSKVFSKVMRGIENINKSGIGHKISVTICEDLFDDFLEIIDAIVKSGVSLFSLDMGRPIIINNRINADGIASPKEMVDFIIKIYPKLLACGVRFNIKFSIPFCLFPEDFLTQLIQNNHLTSGCQIFNGDGIILDPKGRLLPCNHFCDNPLGQLGVDFIIAQEYYQFRANPDVAGFYKTVGSCPNQQCFNCFYWQYCGGGCRVHWLYRNADELLGNFRRKEVKA